MRGKWARRETRRLSINHLPCAGLLVPGLAVSVANLGVSAAGVSDAKVPDAGLTGGRVAGASGAVSVAAIVDVLLEPLLGDVTSAFTFSNFTETSRNCRMTFSTQAGCPPPEGLFLVETGFGILFNTSDSSFWSASTWIRNLDCDCRASASAASRRRCSSFVRASALSNLYCSCRSSSIFERGLGQESKSS